MRRKLWKKIMMILLFGCIAMAGAARAEEKTYIASSVYFLTVNDNTAEVEQQALADARRAALEQVGVYLLAETEVKNYAVTKDEIRSVSMGVVQLLPNGVQKVYQPEQNGLRKLTLTASFVVDEAQILKNLENIAKLHKAKTHSTAERRALSEKELEVESGPYDYVQEHYEKAVALDPTNANAWAHLGIYKKARYGYPNYHNGTGSRRIIVPYDEYFEQKDAAALVLGLKSRVRQEAGSRNRMLAALFDLQRAVELNPSLDEVWFRKGELEWILGNTAKAQISFQRAFALYPKWKICYETMIAYMEVCERE